MEEEYKEVIEVGLGLIEEKLMETFGLTTVDALDIMTEYFEVVQSEVIESLVGEVCNLKREVEELKAEIRSIKNGREK